MHFPMRASLALAAFALAAGCVGTHSGLRFSHRAHPADATCVDCHADAAPAQHAACAPCHDFDPAKPTDACLVCHEEKRYVARARVRPSSYADVAFDHGAHEGVDCARCHAPAGTLPRMSVCQGCHDGSTAPADCATCHEEIRRDRKPAAHDSLWLKRHGAASRGEVSCTYCHDGNSCSDCHRSRRPTSHVATWKNSGHGLAADHDRRPCAACHQADECSRCHGVRPASHYGPAFVTFASDQGSAQGHARLIRQRGGTRSCAACHEPSFCASCHPRGF